MDDSTHVSMHLAVTHMVTCDQKVQWDRGIKTCLQDLGLEFSEEGLPVLCKDVLDRHLGHGLYQVVCVQEGVLQNVAQHLAHSRLAAASTPPGSAHFVVVPIRELQAHLQAQQTLWSCRSESCKHTSRLSRLCGRADQRAAQPIPTSCFDIDHCESGS